MLLINSLAWILIGEVIIISSSRISLQALKGDKYNLKKSNLHLYQNLIETQLLSQDHLMKMLILNQNLHMMTLLLTLSQNHQIMIFLHNHHLMILLPIQNLNQLQLLNLNLSLHLNQLQLQLLSLKKQSLSKLTQAEMTFPKNKLFHNLQQ